MSCSIFAHKERCPGSCLPLCEMAAPPDFEAPLVTDLELLDRTFHRGFRCPRCASEHLHRHGRYRDRQRFRCVDCGRTFNERTMTPLHGTHYPEKWEAYAACLARGYSLRRTARLVGISLPTAFVWRHKLLLALRAGAPTPRLAGLVEFDEVYVLESQKGSRQLRRPARERGTGRSIIRGPGVNRLCLLAGMDRRGGELFTMVGAGELRVFKLEEVLKDTHFEATAVCVDNRQAYWSFSLRHGLPRHVLRNRFHRQDLRHYRTVDGYLERFRRWLLRFNGVATRYLANYVHWFWLHDRAARAGNCTERFARQLFLQSFDAPLRVTHELPQLV